MSGQDTTDIGLVDLLRTQFRVIGALTLREMSSRYGKENLGFLWLFGEPLLLGSAVGVLKAISGHELPGGINPAHFMITSYIAFYMLRAIINRSTSAVYDAQSLLYHRCITLLDIMISKNLLEVAATTFVMLLFLAFWGLATTHWTPHIECVLMAMILFGLFSHGVSMLIAAASVRTEVVDRVTHLVTYLTMPFTGMVFMVDWLPKDWQHTALLIPTVHIYELLRFGLYGSAVPTHFDLLYVVCWIAALNLFGMAELRRARRVLTI